MAVTNLKFRLTGISPLLCHNGRMADQDDEFAVAIKEITGKRQKVQADRVEMARLEFLGGLYLDQNNEPALPGYVFEAALIGKGGGARSQRQGKAAAAGLYVIEDFFRLEYDGPRDPDELWKDKRFVHCSLVRVQQAKIMRTRPIFRNWSVEVSFDIDENLIQPDDARLWVNIAGAECGLGDWRPKFGRFVAEEL